MQLLLNIKMWFVFATQGNVFVSVRYSKTNDNTNLTSSCNSSLGKQQTFRYILQFTSGFGENHSVESVPFMKYDLRLSDVSTGNKV